jgi:magnesium transporter
MKTDWLLAKTYCRAHPAEAARAVERLSPDRVREICVEVEPAVVAPVLAAMDHGVAGAALAELGSDRLEAIEEALPLDLACLLFRRMPTETRTRALARLPAARAAEIRRRLRYRERSAGALADPSVLAFATDVAVADAVAEVRRAGQQLHHHLFVVDRAQVLVGVVSLRELLAAPETVTIGSIARREIAKLNATADLQAILAHPSWTDLHTLPVVDEKGRFVGVLRHATLRRIEAEVAGAQRGQSVVDVMLEFGELSWRAGGGLIGELANAMTGAPVDGSAHLGEDHD